MSSTETVTVSLEETFFPGSRERFSRNMDVRPLWVGPDQFVCRLASDKGIHFWTFNCSTGEKTLAFDHDRVAANLSKALDKTVSPDNLPFSMFRFVNGGTSIQIQLGRNIHDCSLVHDQACTLLFDHPSGVISPDRKWVAYLKDHNLWLRSVDETTDRALTTDGTEDWKYASAPGTSTSFITELRSGAPSVAKLVWSPDSRYILTHRIDERAVLSMPLVQHAPGGNAYRPQLFTYRYSLPGEPKAQLEQVVFEAATGRRIRIGAPATELDLATLIDERSTWWAPNGRSFYYITRGPYSKTLALMEVDVETGKPRCVIEERGKTFVELSGIDEQHNVFITSMGDVIWFSRRDGYAHLYRYDLKTGQLRNRLTEGPWMVRNIIAVDEARGRVYFLASGREPSSHPCNRRLYSVGLDGKDMTLLTPEDAEHVIHGFTPHKPEPLELNRELASISPSGNYVVETFSRADLKPVSVIRRTDGTVLQEICRGELVNLTVPDDVAPEPFEILAADGVTKLYGTLFRPINFDPRCKYPLLDSIYPGPQLTRVRRTYAEGLFDLGLAMSAAQRGFIVFTLDGRGTADRSQAFLDHSYGRLGSVEAFEDHAAAVRQLAERYPFIDASRAGMYGFSGGGFATFRAMCLFPDVFRVGVSVCGNHEQRSYVPRWAETYLGPDDGKNYEDASNVAIAHKLKGKLLLIHGELDDNVHPGHTLQVVDALIKADKDFDMLLVPNANHAVGWSAYVRRRMLDYFARELGGPVRQA